MVGTNSQVLPLKKSVLFQKCQLAYEISGLVMVDDINRRVRDGVPLRKAVELSGCRRFRPIFLTSATTFLGLLPLMADRSLQAQFLIPMAVSLAFGVLFATVITLFLIPNVLVVADDFRGLFSPIFGRSRLGREYQAKRAYQSPDEERS